VTGTCNEIHKKKIYPENLCLKTSIINRCVCVYKHTHIWCVHACTFVLDNMINYEKEISILIVVSDP